MLILLFFDIFTHSVIMDPEKRYLLSWKFDNKTIIFQVIAQTTGWIGLGFSSNGAMTGADIVVAWVENGQGYISVR